MYASTITRTRTQPHTQPDAHQRVSFISADAGLESIQHANHRRSSSNPLINPSTSLQTRVYISALIHYAHVSTYRVSSITRVCVFFFLILRKKRLYMHSFSLLCTCLLICFVLCYETIFFFLFFYTYSAHLFCLCFVFIFIFFLHISTFPFSFLCSHVYTFISHCVHVSIFTLPALRYVSTFHLPLLCVLLSFRIMYLLHFISPPLRTYVHI